MTKKPAAARQTSLAFRKKALSALTTDIGVYALCDLDEVPIYVGQSVDGIRSRVNRHLTSARSDIIANRQIDVWEIAFVKAWPVRGAEDIPHLEAVLFQGFNQSKTLMNGSIPRLTGTMPTSLPAPAQTVQVMSDDDIRVRRDPMLRLPRQIEHIGRLVDHILSVKDSEQLRRSLAAHFERLDAYRVAFLQQGAPVVRAPGESDEE
ncbi:MAG: GIY-YIG nuclease family protein [Phreatobacter sp.]|uniref:GIY-YIG nuclease family protein n=1 Tax=Phreatobacter sp. TaxID=1966341 RepID=UPI001A371CCF|nr:GIY-YIG nuclease family protein [Phreatobacter sp.]MBL8567932.1 GIY-YIG nuclease family protein [Phreatobacter sp.]